MLKLYNMTKKEVETAIRVYGLGL